MSVTDEGLTPLLDALEKVSDQISGLDADREDKIREARKSGATWNQIGDALGISRQAAWERYKKLDPTPPPEVTE